MIHLLTKFEVHSFIHSRTMRGFPNSKIGLCISPASPINRKIFIRWKKNFATSRYMSNLKFLSQFFSEIAGGSKSGGADTRLGVTLWGWKWYHWIPGVLCVINSNYRLPMHRLPTIHERDQPKTNQRTSWHGLSQYAPVIIMSEVHKN